MDILGLNREYIKSFDTYSEAFLDKELNKFPLLSFKVLGNLGKYFKEEGYLQVEGLGEFLIKEKKKSGGYYDIVAKPNMDSFVKDFYPNYTHTTDTFFNIIKNYMSPLGWNIECNDTRKETLTGKNKTTLEIIVQALELFEYEWIWDIKNKTLICGPKVGNDRGSYLHQEVNLRELNVTTQTYDFVTRLIPKGKNDIGIESVNGGLPYLEPSIKYSNKIIYGTWSDERYTIPANLKIAAQKLVDSLGKVYKSYEVDVIDLARLNSKYSYLSYEIGDIITLIDNENGTREKQRIIGKKEYIRERLKDSVRISDSPLSIVQIQEKMQNNLDNKINVTRQYITVLEGEVKQKVSLDTYNELENRLTSAEQKITPEAIANTVTNSEKYIADVNSLKQTITDRTNTLEVNINGFKDEYNKKIIDVDGKVSEINNYLNYDGPSGTLKMGVVGSNFTMNLTNNMLAFLESGNIVAFMNNQKLFIKEAVIQESITIGNHKLMRYDTNLTIVLWTGGAV